MRGSVLLRNLNLAPETRCAKVAEDCTASLNMQKSPDGYLLLTRAYLTGGRGVSKQAEVAALKYLDSVAGNPQSLHMVALTALLAGDQATAREAIVRFTDGEVKNGRVDAGTIGSARLSVAEMRSYLPSFSASSDKQMLSAFIDFSHGNYAAAFALEKNRSAGEVGQTAKTMALCANILQKRLVAAKVLADQLGKKSGPTADALTLLDDLYFVSDQRDDGLKQLDALEVLPGADKEAIEMARASILDQMGQPEQALKVLAGVKATARRDKPPVGMSYTFLDRDPSLELARLEAKLNHADVALKHLQKCIASRPEAGQPYFMRAQIYAQQSKWPQAKADLTAAINDGFSLVKACRARAGCSNALGDRASSKVDLDLAAAFLGQR